MPPQNKIIFLDRDGVVNKERGECITRVKDFELLEQNFSFYQYCTDKGYKFVIITNQSCIALGKLKVEDLTSMHYTIKESFKHNAWTLLDILYCPHHPDINGVCLCRKPNSLLFEKAISKYDIDITASYMIGDKKRDIEAAARVSIKGVLVKENTALMDYLSSFDLA